MRTKQPATSINVRRGWRGGYYANKNNLLQLDGRQVLGLVVVSSLILTFLVSNDTLSSAQSSPELFAPLIEFTETQRPKSRVLMTTFVYGEGAMNSKRMQFFLKSVATCGLDYVMMGDAVPKFPLPPNVIHVQKTWDDLIDDIHNGLFDGSDEELEQNRHFFEELKTAKVNKVNDFKALFAFLYPHLVEGYDWWGWTDNDMLIGNVMKFVNNQEEGGDNLLDNYDVICGNPSRQSWGPFQMFRNRPDINTLFRESGKPLNQSLIVMQKSMIFDEWGNGREYFVDSMAGIIKRNQKLKGIRLKRGLGPDGDKSGWYRDTGECQFKYKGIDKVPPRCGEAILYPNGTLVRSLDGSELWFAHFRTSKKFHDPSVADPIKFKELLQPDRPIRVTFKEGFDYVDPNDPRPLA